jgi:16S rRNA processing protein RimM
VNSRAPGQRVCVAQIGAPHGVRGEVKLRAFTENPLAIGTYGPLETDGDRHLEIDSMRAAAGVLVVRFAGVSDRSAAEALRNLRLYLPRARLPDTEDAETFYHADLIGLAALAADGTPLGTVAAVQNFGAGDLLEVTPQGGGPAVLLPFTRAVVPEVDVEGGRIVVNPPEDAFAPGERRSEPSPAAGAKR